MKAKRSMALTMAAAMTLGLVVSNGTLAKMMWLRSNSRLTLPVRM